MITQTLKMMIEKGTQPLLSEYPIFEEAYRIKLNSKITEHFLYREICCTDISQFNFYLSRQLKEIMPYYNQLYKTELIKINPLINFKNTISRILKSDGFSENTTKQNDKINGNRTSSENGKDKSIYLDTPSNIIDIDINNVDYATNLGVNGSNKSSEDKTDENIARDIQGNIKSNQNQSEDTINTGLVNMTETQLIEEYRNILLNIDMLVIYELEECFIQLWSDM